MFFSLKYDYPWINFFLNIRGGSDISSADKGGRAEFHFVSKFIKNIIE